MKNTSFARFRIIFYLCAAIMVIIVWQIARIQTSAAAKVIGESSRNLEFETHKIIPERGNIYDRWGHLLAGNAEVYEVGVDLRNVRSPETVAATLATYLDVDYAKTLERASKPFVAGVSEYQVLAHFVTPDQIKKLENDKKKYAALTADRGDKDLPSLSGLLWQPRLMRSYPEKTLASNVIGFQMFKDREKGSGTHGVEERYNDLLAGTPQTILVPLDPYQSTELPKVPPGASLVLTIDREIQAMAERVLDKNIESSGAEGGTIIISDPRNGEILAMAVTPRMNLNEYWKYEEIFDKNTPFNRAVGENYEPGSVFKVLTMAAALDAGVVTPTTSFLDTGSIEVAGINFYNWDRGVWGPQDMTGCMRHSLNVCLTWVAVQLTPTRFYEYMQAFGIGHRTNIDLGGEVLWPLAMPDDGGWSPVNLATNSFGQGVSVTPIQMVMAVSALANDGKMMAPHVLKAVIDGDRQYDNNPQVIGNPISAKAAQEITEMLAVSLEQEASNALVEGYRVAGKTGTGEIPTPSGYTIGLTNASFVGWGPVDDPQFLVYVWLEKPQSSIWGSVVAAPVFSETVTELVRLINLPPDDMRRELAGQ